MRGWESYIRRVTPYTPCLLYTSMQGLFPETSGMSRLLPCGFPAWEEKEAGRLQIPAACLYPFWELPAFP